MKRAVILCGVILLIGVVYAAAYFNKTPSAVLETEKPVVKIGVILPLTGNMSVMGQSIKNAVLLAQSDLGQMNLRNSYEFIFDDDGYEGKKDALIFNKQRDIDKVAAILSFGSTTGNVLASRTEEAKIIYINVGASDVNVAKGAYNFIHWTMPQETVIKMLEHHKKSGFKKIAFMAGNDIGTLALQETYVKLAPNYNIDVKTYNFNADEKEFKMLFTKTKAYNPDAYVALIWGANFAPFMKQFKEAAISKPLTGIESLSTIGDYQAIEGVYFSDGAVANNRFNERLYSKFPNHATDYATGNAYDAIMLLVKAFETAATKENAVKSLQEIREYEGVTGKVIQDLNGIFKAQAVLKKIQNGKPIVVEE